MKTELLVITGYGSARLYVITGNSVDVSLKVRELKERFTSVGPVEITPEIEAKFPTALDRWALDEIEYLEL